MSENQDADECPTEPTTAIATVQKPQDTTPEGLMALAINRGIDVAGLEKLMVLASQVREHRAKMAFISALSAFQEECPVIEKTRNVMNKDGRSVRYRFAAMEDISAVIAPIMGRHGLSYTFDTSVDDAKNLAVFCSVRHVDGHGEQSSFSVPIGNSGHMSQPQEFAAALTYAKRYALINALGLVIGDEDNDAAPPAKPSPQPQQATQQPLQQAPPAKPAPEPAKTELDVAMADWSGFFASDPTVKQLNDRLPLLGSLGENVKNVVKGLIREQAAAGGLAWDKELKCYFIPEHQPAT